MKVNELLVADSNVALDGLDRLEDVPEVVGVPAHRATASRRTAGRRWGERDRSVTTSTRRPRASSSSCLRATKSRRERSGARAMRRSRSLSGAASPRAREPNTRTFRAPCRAAISRILLRCSRRSRSVTTEAYQGGSQRVSLRAMRGRARKPLPGSRERPELVEPVRPRPPRLAGARRGPPRWRGRRCEGCSGSWGSPWPRGPSGSVLVSRPRLRFVLGSVSTSPSTSSAETASRPRHCRESARGPEGLAGTSHGPGAAMGQGWNRVSSP